MKKLIMIVAATVSIAFATAWLQKLQAQDSTNSSVDKWTTIENTNKDLSKSLEEIEQNLNFIKARSMQGGRRS
jgi:hypothetical protein